MNRELLSITLQMVKPLNDLEHNLSCDIGEVVFTHPLTEMRIEIYKKLECYEWRLVLIEPTNTGAAQKVCKFDSATCFYYSLNAALRDAIVFSFINKF